MKPINVTKTYLPPIEEYQRYLRQIWDNGQVTNQGPLLQEFESAVAEKLKVSNFQLLTNGTLALQVALRALDITEGEVITTPFSYVATTSAILWEHLTPVFVDIEPDTFCIDADKIEASITNNTKAILAVHVFGYPCDIEKIDAIAQKHNLKVIYDSAHAFGARFQGKSLLDYGDISMGSLHATKLFHTIEGGCLVAREKSVAEKIALMKRFGHNGDEYYMLGTNAKASEFQAAMGLCILPHVDELIAQRRAITEHYNTHLDEKVRKPHIAHPDDYNYAYYPIILQDARMLTAVVDALKKENIFPRRYFYPSLNTLPYVNNPQPCPISEDIAERVLCLPLYSGLDLADVGRISTIINRTV